MSRSIRSAKQAGTRFERKVADYLSAAFGDSDIDRQIKTGSRDVGDIRGVYRNGHKVTIECKDCSRMELAKWIGEAEVEAGNADSPFPVVVHKRKGVGSMSEQYVTMTLETFAGILAGGPELIERSTDE